MATVEEPRTEGVIPPQSNDAQKAKPANQKRSWPHWPFAKKEPSPDNTWELDVPHSITEQKVEMKGTDQARFITEILFSRYDTMMTVPKTKHQAVDLLTDWCIKEIAAENGVKFDDLRGKGEKDFRDRIAQNVSTMRLENLDRGTRDMAYYLAVITQNEMMAAAGVIPKDAAYKTHGIEGKPLDLIVGLGEGFVTSDAILSLTAKLRGNVPRSGPLRDLWKRAEKMGLITAYDPVSKMYESVFTNTKYGSGRVVGDGGRVTIDARLIRDIRINDELILQFETAATGGNITVHDSIYREIADVLTGSYDAKEVRKSDFRQKQIFVTQLDKILERDFQGRKLADISIEDRYRIFSQAARESITATTGDQVAEIIKVAADNTITDESLALAENKLTEPEKEGAPKSEAVKLTKSIEGVKTAQTDWKAKLKERDDKIKENDKDRARLTTEQTQKTRDLADMRVKLRGASSGGAASIQSSIEALEKRLEEIRENLTKIPAAGTRIPEDEALDNAVAEVKAKLTGFADAATIGAIITNVGGVDTVDKTRLDSFLIGKSSDKEKATELAGEKKAVGLDVLEIIKTKRDAAIEVFATGNVNFEEGANSVRHYDNFLRLLGLDKVDKRVLPQERLMKILIVNLELEDFNPADIDPKSKDFNAQWDTIIKALASKDGLVRGKAIANIYIDRLSASDVFADNAGYYRPKYTPDLQEVRMERELATEEMARNWQLLGANVTAVEQGDMVAVGENGNVKVMRRSERTGNEIKLIPLGDLGLKLAKETVTAVIGGANVPDTDTTRVIIENMGSTELQAARRAFLSDPARVTEGFEIFFATKPNDYFEPMVCDDGITNVTIGKDAAGTIVVDDGAGPIPLANFLAARPNLLEIQGAGRWMVERVQERSKALNRIQAVKGTGFKTSDGTKIEELDPEHPPTEIRWADPTVAVGVQSEIIVHMDDPSGVYLERQRLDAATGIWVAEPVIAAIGTSARMNLNDFVKVKTSQDVTAVKERLLASVYDILARLTPAQRRALLVTGSGGRRLSAPARSVQISVENRLPNAPLIGKLAVGLDDNGEMVIFDAAGARHPLPRELNLGIIGNEITRLDTVPSNPSRIRKHPLLAIQEEMGSILLNGINDRLTKV